LQRLTPGGLLDSQPQFDLSKWYLDCVSQEGNVFIAYSARLRWKSFTLHYASRLLFTDDAATQSKSTLRRGRPPAADRDVVRWDSPALEVRGEWNALSEPIEETIFEDEAGRIRWRCLQPRAAANVRLERNRAITGYGYVEHLQMTIPPWRLPIQQLRWGRFLSDTDALVWIDWSGPHAKRIVYHNGEAASAGSISDEELILAAPPATLSLDRRRVLREGALTSIALSKIPGLAKVFPSHILNVHECKWLSRGVLRRSSGSEAAGWAIHEIVQWPS